MRLPCGSAVLLNKHFDKIDLDDIIAKNQEKAKKKREKMGVTENADFNAAAMNTRSIQSKAKCFFCKQELELELEKANALKANAKPGSMAAKANLVLLKRNLEKRIIVNKYRGQLLLWSILRFLLKMWMTRLHRLLLQLGITSDQLEYEVIDKGSTGFLGIARKML